MTSWLFTSEKATNNSSFVTIIKIQHNPTTNLVQEASVWIFLDLGFDFQLEFHQYKFRNLPWFFCLNKLNFHIDYNCFVNQLDHKMQNIGKKRETCKKKKQGDFNFALEFREGDFSWYRARISPTSPGVVSPVQYCSWAIGERKVI